ncbi:ABC transporter permease [Sphingobacterium sp. DK4209]|uniref:ABC transporter permease n=1 Tax=Sphingobacterium zhuxiongii TaxID=2662364 RepID=A0A5Q0QFY6_9SPHI|nr:MULTISPECIES: ABC transporter permease [unclassified Sphingobacterium]MVZ65193.1 ABC transporter permease [Sphingobacterium sp. DK4209]QGA26140.1 ABC transporter permease [Sphingobacterium sp. dk4302]
MKNFISLLKREFSLFFQNKVLMVLFLGAPIMYAVLIGGVYKKGKVTNLPIIVVDEDRSPMSQQLIEMFNESEVIYVAEVLNDGFKAKEEALRTESTVVVQIPRNFSSNINYGRSTELTLFVNASNTLTSNYAMMAVNVAAGTMKAGIQIKAQQKKGVPEFVASQQYEPFKTTIIKQHIRSGNYLYFMLPGVLLTVLQQVMMLGLALSFASEFEKGTFTDLVARSKNVFLLILVKVLPYILMSVFIVFLYYGFSVFYRMPLQLSGISFYVYTLLFLLAVAFIGILVSIAIPSQLKATEILMVIATPSFILSGFTWPLSQMPEWIVCIAKVIPLTHYLQIFRTMIIEQGGAAYVQEAVWGLVLIASIALLLSVVLLQLKINKANKELKAQA